jgi:crotonobetaine/carnitine-CoA ligase
MDYPTPTPVAISALAEQKPDVVAIESISTNEQFSWKEVDDHCRRWADALRRLKVGHREPVVTLFPNNPDAAFAWIGCAWLHAIEIPVNPGYRGEWLIHAIDNTRARIIVTSRHYLTSLAAVAPHLPHVKIVVIYDARPEDRAEFGRSIRVVRGAEFFADSEPAQDFQPPRVSDLMGAVYTSGTTGMSKAVLLPWGTLSGTLDVFRGVEFEYPILYGFAPPFHGMGKTSIILPAAFDGRLVLREQFSATEFWDDIRKYGCTATFTISVIPRFLMSQAPREDDADNPLRAVIMGPVIPEVDNFKQRFGVNVYTTFGSTEVGGAFAPHEGGVNGTNWQSCGHVAPDGPVEVAIADEEDFPVGPNTVGELIVRPRHPWTMNLGYLNMPEETVRAWRNGWYHTGDTFTYDENGYYYFLDRTKDCIRRRGENISSFEVEKSVNQFPDVERSAAVAVPSEVGEDEVMVFVVPNEGASVDPVELIQFLVDRLPPFAVPRYIEVVDSLPMTQATFRVQKAKLREHGPSKSTFDRVQAGA